MKTIASVVATLLTATMLSLGLGASPASATCDNYGPCFDTRLSAWSQQNPIRPRRSASFAVRIRSEDGRSPNATLSIRVIRRANGNVVWSGRRFYDGGTESYRTGRLPRGSFRVSVQARVHNDNYQNARAIFGQRVTR